MSIADIQEKQVTLEATIATALEASKALAPGTAEFDEAYGRYLAAKTNLAKIPEELVQAKRAENAAAIATDCITLGAAIRELMSPTGMNTAAKLGEPIVSVVWTQGATGIDGIVPEPVVKVNPKVAVKSTGAKRDVKTGGHNMIGLPDGSETSLTKFVLSVKDLLSADEVTKATYKTGFTPHVLIDSKPKFEAFCTAHSLTGYTYVTPGASEPAAEA